MKIEYREALNDYMEIFIKYISWFLVCREFLKIEKRVVMPFFLTQIPPLSFKWQGSLTKVNKSNWYSGGSRVGGAGYKVSALYALS